MNKKLIIILLAGILLGAFVSSYLHTGEVQYSAPETVEKEVVVPELETLIQEAQEEARAEVETFAQDAYDDAYEQRMREIAIEVRSMYIENLRELNESQKREAEAY